MTKATWVRSEDRLPEKGRQAVLLHDGRLGRIGLGYLMLDDNWWWVPGPYEIPRDSDFIDHWMPLPDPLPTEQWIDIEQLLPHKNDLVLLYNAAAAGDNRICIDWLREDGSWQCNFALPAVGQGYSPGNYITHWIALPDSP